METIGKYQVQRVLGHGGMGTVYEALDPHLQRKIALKTMTPGLADTPELRERFQREAQAAAGLRHRNIVTVYELGEDKGSPYIAMELVEGTDLEKIIQARQTLSVEWKLDVLRQICEGLSYAHRNGIVHRDVKPANVRVTPEGEVKVVDFGIAYLQSSTMTKGGVVLGTVHYMAPERIEGRKIDQRADIFSVGAIAYELIAYRKPFDGDSLTGVMFKITHEAPDASVIPRTPYSPALEKVILKALAKDPDQRYGSLDQMHADLAGMVRTVTAPPPRPVQAGGTGPLPVPPPAAAATTDPAEALRRRVESEVAAIRGEAQRARAEGQLQKALGLCRRLLELDPDDAETSRMAAQIESSIRDKEIEQLAAQALAYAADGDLELASKIAARVERLAPDSPRVAHLRSYLNDESRRRSVGALTARAQEHVVMGNLEEARAAAEEALQADPKNALAREIRDRAAEVLAQKQKALFTPVPLPADPDGPSMPAPPAVPTAAAPSAPVVPPPVAAPPPAAAPGPTAAPVASKPASPPSAVAAPAAAKAPPPPSTVPPAAKPSPVPARATTPSSTAPTSGAPTPAVPPSGSRPTSQTGPLPTPSATARPAAKTGPIPVPIEAAKPATTTGPLPVAREARAASGAPPAPTSAPTGTGPTATGPTVPSTATAPTGKPAAKAASPATSPKEAPGPKDASVGGPKTAVPAPAKPLESKPAEPKPTEPKPTEVKPTEPKLTEPKPKELRPPEVKPSEPKPAEPKPPEPKPTELKPAEPKPAEPKPTERPAPPPTARPPAASAPAAAKGDGSPKTAPAPAVPAPKPAAGASKPAAPAPPSASVAAPAQGGKEPAALTPLPEGVPSDPEAARLLESARRLLRERAPQKALPLLEQAAAVDGAHAGIQRLLGLTKLEARRSEVESLTSAALNHFVKNDYVKARREVDKALALEPDNKKARELKKILGALG